MDPDYYVNHVLVGSAPDVGCPWLCQGDRSHDEMNAICGLEWKVGASTNDHAVCWRRGLGKLQVFSNGSTQVRRALSR